MNKPEIKTMAEKVLKINKDNFKQLDELDTEIAAYDGSPNPETIKKWARRAAGLGNNVSKSFSKVYGIRKREERSNYMKLKTKSAIDNIKFVSTVANEESKNLTSDLKIAESILESYYEGAKTNISICRMHASLDEDAKSIGAQL